MTQTPIPTTTTAPRVEDGRIVLDVHAFDGVHVTSMVFDVDAYALELANALLGAVVDRQSRL